MLGILERLPWPQRITAAVLGAAAIAVVVLEGLSAETVPTAVGIVGCGVLAVAMLFMPTVQPGVVCGVAGLSFAFTIVCTQLDVRLDNTFGVVELGALSWLVVRVVLQQPPKRSVWLVVVLFFAIVLLPLRLNEANGNDLKATMGAVLALAVGFMALLGMYLRLHDRRRADAFELARQTQRLEYARDLHDFVAHHVTAIVAQAKAVRYTTSMGQQPDPAALDSMLAGIEKAGSDALVSMRGMITVLREDSQESTRPYRTLGEVVSAAVSHFSAVGPTATASIDDDIADRHLPQATLDAAHHLVQEALTNVLRHAAEVSHVEVSAHVQPDDPNQVEITVTNDGHAGDTGLPSGGFGLVGLSERVETAGGRLSAGPTGTGWRVTGVLPMKPALR